MLAISFFYYYLIIWLTRNISCLNNLIFIFNIFLKFVHWLKFTLLFLEFIGKWNLLLIFKFSYQVFILLILFTFLKWLIISNNNLFFLLILKIGNNSFRSNILCSLKHLILFELYINTCIFCFSLFVYEQTLIIWYIFIWILKLFIFLFNILIFI